MTYADSKFPFHELKCLAGRPEFNRRAEPYTFVSEYTKSCDYINFDSAFSVCSVYSVVENNLVLLKDTFCLKE